MVDERRDAECFVGMIEGGAEVKLKCARLARRRRTHVSTWKKVKFIHVTHLGVLGERAETLITADLGFTCIVT
jgi:hypothetical protein